jgi:hypothetical protein
MSRIFVVIAASRPATADASERKPGRVEEAQQISRSRETKTEKKTKETGGRRRQLTN